MTDFELTIGGTVRFANGSPSLALDRAQREMLRYLHQEPHLQAASITAEAGGEPVIISVGSVDDDRDDSR